MYGIRSRGVDADARRQGCDRHRRGPGRRRRRRAGAGRRRRRGGGRRPDEVEGRADRRDITERGGSRRRRRVRRDRPGPGAGVRRPDRARVRHRRHPREQRAGARRSGRSPRSPKSCSTTGWKTGPLATFRFMRACYPHLKGGGVIVNMGSGSAIRPDLTAFGGLRRLQGGDPHDEPRRRVRVGARRHPGQRRAAARDVAGDGGLPRSTTPTRATACSGRSRSGSSATASNDVGPAVVWLCSDAATYVTGTSLCVDGGQDYVR